MPIPTMLLEKMSVFAAKLETTAGTAEALTVAEGAYNVHDLKIEPQAGFRERPRQGGFNRMASIAEGYPGKATFAMDLTCGSAAPPWATVLLAACGMGAVTGVYTLDARPIGASGSTQKTVTLGQYENGRLKRLHGAMGNAKFMFPSSKVASVEFDFSGIYGEVTDVAQIAPTYPTDAPLFFVDQDFTIGSWVPQISQLTLDLGNKVYLRPGQSDTGLFYACITDRLPKITLDPEASLVADHDLFGLWRAMNEAAITWKAQSSATDHATFAATKFQSTNISRVGREGVLVDQLEGQLNADDLHCTFVHSA